MNRLIPTMSPDQRPSTKIFCQGQSLAISYIGTGSRRDTRTSPHIHPQPHPVTRDAASKMIRINNIPHTLGIPGSCWCPGSPCGVHGIQGDDFPCSSESFRQTCRALWEILRCFAICLQVMPSLCICLALGRSTSPTDERERYGKSPTEIPSALPPILFQ